MRNAQAREIAARSSLISSAMDQCSGCCTPLELTRVLFGPALGAAFEMLFVDFHGDSTSITTNYDAVHDPIDTRRALVSDRPFRYHMNHVTWIERKHLIRLKKHTSSAYIPGDAAPCLEGLTVFRDNKLDINFDGIALALATF